MLRERLRGFIQSQSGSPVSPAQGSAGLDSGGGRTPKLEDFVSRHSNGLDQFFSYIKGESGLSILDIRTGSGCIAIALKKKLPDAQVFACDFSQEALNVARQNSQLNGTEIDLIFCDVLNEEAE